MISFHDVVMSIALIIALSFMFSTVKYIYHRHKMAVWMKETSNVVIENYDMDDDDDDFDAIEQLVTNNNNNNSRINIIDSDWCKNLVLEIPDDNDDDNICDNLGDGLCKHIEMKRVKIPNDLTSELYTSNGIKLMPGRSYCLYKQPPLKHSDQRCDSVWGFWKYSPVYERWLCKSKVPGVYSAGTNLFDACQREDPKGQLLFDGQPIDDIKNIPEIIPESFNSLDFQARFECQCPTSGFVSRPDLSRTSCYNDPCLATLPRLAVAPGYNILDDSCDCGSHFGNMFNDKKYPCTACPSSFPSYDEQSKIMTIYVKCDGGDNPSFGLFPCLSDEDKIRGCIKATVKIKALKQTDDDTFEDRIFF